MKIKIEEIPASGLYKEEIYNPQELDLEIGESNFSLPVRFCGDVFAGAEIKLIDDELIIDLEVKYKLKMICSRCLEEFELPFEKRYLFNYNTLNLEVIDITSRIREEIILEYPMKPLCREDCKGICPRCGSNLNYEECRCQS